MTSLSVKKLKDYALNEDGSYLVPIICNIRQKDQEESKLESLSHSKNLNKLDEFLSLKNTSYKYKWNISVDSGDHPIASDSNVKNDLNGDEFIYRLLSKCTKLGEITENCRRLLNSTSASQRITIETYFYDKTEGTKSKNCALNVSINMCSPDPQPKKSMLIRKEKKIEDSFKPTKLRPNDADVKVNEKKRRKTVSFKTPIKALEQIGYDESSNNKGKSKAKKKKASIELAKDVDVEATKVKAKKKEAPNKNSTNNDHQQEKALNGVCKQIVENIDKRIGETLYSNQTINKLNEKNLPKKVQSKSSINVLDKINKEELAKECKLKTIEKETNEVTKNFESQSPKIKSKKKEISEINNDIIDQQEQVQVNVDETICHIWERKFASKRGTAQHIRIAHKQNTKQ